jgi:hypothetical protein
MGRSPVTREEIRHLARRLEQLGPALSESERTALLTVFEFAASSLPGSASDTESIILPGSVITRDPITNGERAAQEELPPLVEGFASAFRPGTAARFVLENRTSEDAASRRPAITVRLV